MKAAVAVNASKIGELLAALLTEKLIQPDLDENTRARFVMIGVEGEDYTLALVLAPEADIERLDAQVWDGDPSDDVSLVNDGSGRFDFCKDSMRLRVFKNPVAPAPYTHSVVCNQLKDFLKTMEPTADQEQTAEQTVDDGESCRVLMQPTLQHVFSQQTTHIWLDVFGRTEGELVPQDTGDDKLYIIASIKPALGWLFSLLRDLPIDWMGAVHRSSIDYDPLSIENPPDWLVAMQRSVVDIDQLSTQDGCVPWITDSDSDSQYTVWRHPAAGTRTFWTTVIVSLGVVVLWVPLYHYGIDSTFASLRRLTGQPSSSSSSSSSS
ncbi:putative transmembrane protein [Gregarina niphandrodes]|uniref:Transmembrane protein n=1 Tax=Gregarina niphandrodes TaxID=110365 RepID=A0A023AYL4_GRENI|nr:putative transmembrane protein [Gregarina niphandrodes]EZG43739.1 putative transmembrane protein [Gregarina niphandrodes]|eukprot:XP_011133026.1 putative transmembrane protein [Gregarina niphandrodes]